MNNAMTRHLIFAILFCASCGSEAPDTAHQQLGLNGPVCDDSAGVRLALTGTLGGPVAPDGVEFIGENGGGFALITGECVAILQDKIGAPIVRLQLTKSEANALVQELNADEWGKLNSEQCIYGEDRGSTRLIAGSARLKLTLCDGPEAEEAALAAVQAFGTALDRLYSQGQPTDDLPMRYMLVENGVTSIYLSEEFEDAPTLSVDLEPVTWTEGVQPKTATGTLAATLRGLWTPKARGPGVLVKDAKGRELILYFRDVAEGFEDGEGNWSF